MSWFRTAGICENYSLESFSRELYLFSATEPRPDRLPIDTEYLREERKYGIIKAIVKAVLRGISSVAIMSALAAAGLTGVYWAHMVEKVQREVEAGRTVVPADIDRELSTLPIPESTPEESDVPQAIVDESSVGIAAYIRQNEGAEAEVYDDGSGNLTIGVGHLIEPGDRELFRRLFGDAIDYDALLAGRQTLNSDQIDQLFAVDLQEHIDRARRLINNFDAYPQEVKEAMVDGIYRGDLGPETIGLMNRGEWNLVVYRDENGRLKGEYLNHDGYRRSREALDRRNSYPEGDPRRRAPLSNAGIAPRMERNAERFEAYAAGLRQVR